MKNRNVEKKTEKTGQILREKKNIFDDSKQQEIEKQTNRKNVTIKVSHRFVCLQKSNR